MGNVVDESQLRLFDIENPLRQRFSDSFFKRIPTVSGVYWMLDRHGRVIYVGKAKNLRLRLRSYRGKGFTLFPSKTQRLLLNAQEIHWRETADEITALLLESEWLRILKPRFNVLGTSSESYSYFSLRDSEFGLHLDLVVGRMPQDLHARVFGAFRGIAGARRAQAALTRWLWAVAHEHCNWPVRFFRPTLPLQVFIPWPADSEATAFLNEMIPTLVEAYLLGNAALPELLLPEEEPSLFLQSIWLSDQIQLARFFHSCEGLRLIREKFALGSRPLSIEEVDNLRIIARGVS